MKHVLGTNEHFTISKNGTDTNVDEALAKCTEITYANLVTLRNNSGLVAGMWYRITDYEATVLSVLEPNARSAGHAFDILVRADSTTQLNEDAYAIHHSGDTYFDNSNLAAWELKYTIDNIYWSLAPAEYITLSYSGRSVIALYDGTENINGTTYLRWVAPVSIGPNKFVYSTSNSVGETLYYYYNGSIGQISSIDSYGKNDGQGKGTIVWMKDEFGNELSYDFKNIQFKRFYTTDAKGRDGIDSCYMVADPNNSAKDLSVDDTDNFIWAYTFSSNREGGTQTDTSLSGGITNNVIGSNNDSLPNNVFYGMSIYSNTFGDYCYNNSIGNYFRYNTIGNEFNNNSIGNDCYDNSIGNNCYQNSIGNSCRSNSIGNNVYNNTIGNYFQFNTIGNGFNNNSIGEWFYQNTIGNEFNNNSIGKNCYYNTIGESFYQNSIGNGFQDNSIGNGCNNIKIRKDYVCFIVIENGNHHINITSTQTTSSSQMLRNFTVAQGVNNSNSTKTISHNTTNDTFRTTYQNANSTTTNV